MWREKPFAAAGQTLLLGGWQFGGKFGDNFNTTYEPTPSLDSSHQFYYSAAGEPEGLL